MEPLILALILLGALAWLTDLINYSEAAVLGFWPGPDRAQRGP